VNRISPFEFLHWRLFGGDTSFLSLEQNIALQIRTRYLPEKSNTTFHRTQESGKLFSWMFAFLKDHSQVLEKTFLGGRRLTFQRSRERIYNS
jgi:hypothetical protein